MKSRKQQAVCLLLFAAIPTAFAEPGDIPPETTIDVDPGAVTQDSTPTFAFSSSEANSSFECSVDGGAWQPCDSPLTLGGTGLADGAHTFAVVATDAAGNADPTAAEHAFIVDTIAPQVVIDSPANGETIPFGAVAFAQYTCTDPGGSGVATCDGTLADGAPLDTSTAGPQMFTVVGIDEAGNPFEATSNWTVSAMPPANDNCAGAIDIGNSDGVFPFDNTSATDGPSDCFMGKDVWFVWSPPFDGEVTFETCGLVDEIADTVIGVYSGDCGGLALEVCDDDGCSGGNRLESKLTFTALASRSYLLEIGVFPGSEGGAGSFRLSTVADCNHNGTPDAEEDLPDCNSNGIPDECEDLPDCDEDGIPDECNDSCDLACLEVNRSEDLTPLDTLTVYTRHHNPEHDQGYLYAYAVDGQDRAIARDELIGSLLFVDGYNVLEYSVNAVDYRASVAAGTLTDMDGDGVLDLNGMEYEKTAGNLMVPRFFGQNGRFQSDLITIGLSGGTQFETVVQYYIYNDDEDQFSAQSTFTCWEKSSVSDISGAFNNHWLRNFSGQNTEEGFGMQEYGWFRLYGKTAHSAFVDIPDPAIYAVYVEHLSGTGAADLPFESCTQSGHLLPQGVGGDNDEGFGASSDRDCTERIARRRPGSLLLFTEFDNRFGMVTVITVTNTSTTEDVRVHYVYRGRYGG